MERTNRRSGGRPEEARSRARHENPASFASRVANLSTTDAAFFTLSVIFNFAPTLACIPL